VQHKDIAVFDVTLSTLLIQIFVYKFFVPLGNILPLSCFIQCFSTQHRPPPTRFRYSAIRYSSIQGLDKTTSGFDFDVRIVIGMLFRI